MHKSGLIIKFELTYFDCGERLLCAAGKQLFSVITYELTEDHL
jgi:hypothetical protein